jgi:hypothetical protein
LSWSASPVFPIRTWDPSADQGVLERYRGLGAMPAATLAGLRLDTPVAETDAVAATGVIVRKV